MTKNSSNGIGITITIITMINFVYLLFVFVGETDGSPDFVGVRGGRVHAVGGLAAQGQNVTKH